MTDAGPGAPADATTTGILSRENVRRPRLVPGAVRLAALIAVHEIRGLLRTRRALLALGTYLLGAALGAAGVVTSLRLMEGEATRLLERRGLQPDSARDTLSRLSGPAFENMLAFFSGVEVDRLSPWFTQSYVLPGFLWGSLVFLPLIIIVTTFDHIVSDAHSGALRYSALRTSRWTLLFGRVLAQVALLFALSVAAAALWVLLAATFLSSFSVAETLPGLLRAALTLLPFGLCYVCSTTLCSAVARRPFDALIGSVALLCCLRALGWTRHIPSEHPLGGLRLLEYVSPSTYEPGLWTAGFVAPALSALAYGAFAAIFFGIAGARFCRRGL